MEGKRPNPNPPRFDPHWRDAGSGQIEPPIGQPWRHWEGFDETLQARETQVTQTAQRRSPSPLNPQRRSPGWLLVVNAMAIAPRQRQHQAQRL